MKKCTIRGKEIRKGDIIKHDKMIKKVYACVVSGDLGYCSNYGDFVALKNSSLPWIIAKDGE